MYDLLAADIGGHGIPHDFWSAPNITAGFLALPGSSFVVTGAAPATDLLIASAGVEVGFRNGFSVGARFDGEFAEHNHYLLIGHEPGVLQGGGAARVVAMASAEAGPSTPFTIAETCQR
jgi:hypothetical protein